MKYYIYWLEDQHGNKYIGSRQHVCPENDTYMGSSKYLRQLEKSGSYFVKTILAYFETRDLANEAEMALLKAYNAISDPTFVNKAIGKPRQPELISLGGKMAQKSAKISHVHHLGGKAVHAKYPNLMRDLGKKYQAGATIKAKELMMSVDDGKITSRNTRWRHEKATRYSHTWIVL